MEEGLTHEMSVSEPITACLSMCTMPGMPKSLMQAMRVPTWCIKLLVLLTSYRSHRYFSINVISCYNCVGAFIAIK